ncbi:hypothetical protein C241_15223 [Bradyrhizobium lupini HPC(L)]|uniref:Uncharacterized protein n=1 Tax=Bradyrhizobium lupini HPC(L) TaxID=1229491 RepID=A0ABN0HKL4_RHILU|nr:hypothetical protein C241_15223 [Bradyrhizobium lupini HPC(L)]
MPKPSNFQECPLRRLLFRWAARFTADERMQSRLVEKTIGEIIREFPGADHDSRIDVELLATLRGVALREFTARPRPGVERRFESNQIAPNDQ